MEFLIASPGERFPKVRPLNTVEGRGDRMRTAAFAEVQARDAFLWAADTFTTASPFKGSGPYSQAPVAPQAAARYGAVSAKLDFAVEDTMDTVDRVDALLDRIPALRVVELGLFGARGHLRRISDRELEGLAHTVRRNLLRGQTVWIGEIEDAAQHVTLVLLHRTGLGVERDRAAERVLGRRQRRRLGRYAKEAECVVDQALNQARDGCEECHQHPRPGATARAICSGLRIA